MFKPSLVLIAACLVLTSADAPDPERHLTWTAARWRIQRRGTPNPRRVPPAQLASLKTIKDGRNLVPFPADLQAQVAKDYDMLKWKLNVMGEVQEMEVDYGFSEGKGWENNSEHKWKVCFLRDGSMVMISPITATIRLIVPPSISYGELSLIKGVPGGCVQFSAENQKKFRAEYEKSKNANDKNIELSITSKNASVKFSYTSRQGATSDRLTLREALTFEDKTFVAYFKKSFEDFAALIDEKNGAKHHIHIEWMPIRQGDLDKTVIEWILIDSGYVFDKKTNEGIQPKLINGTIVEIDENKRRELGWETRQGTAQPHNTLISPVCPDEADKSPIALQVCPISRENNGYADNGDEHCANIRNFMLRGEIAQVRTVWAEVGRQALKMVEDTDENNPLRIWTVGGSIGWLHIKMCRDFVRCGRPSVPQPQGKDPLCAGWATQCATAQARRNDGTAWHHVFKPF